MPTGASPEPSRTFVAQSDSRLSPPTTSVRFGSKADIRGEANAGWVAYPSRRNVWSLVILDATYTLHTP